MEDQFDLKKFLIENKLTTLSLREEDNDWDIKVGDNWNVQELNVGDYITQEMLNDTLFTKAWRALNQDIKIVKFKKDPFSGDDLFVVEYIGDNGKSRQNDIDVESFNQYFLKPQYRIVPPDDLNEQDNDEWDLEVGDNWNEKELKVGDYWFDSSVPGWTGVWSNYKDVPNVLKDMVLQITYIGPYKPEFNKPHYDDENVVAMERGDEKHVLKIDYFNGDYGPKLNAYIPTHNLNESDDEWDITTDSFDVTELTVGDKFTPEMFTDSAVSHYKWVDGGIIKKYDIGNDHIGIHDWIQISYINDKGKRKYSWHNVYTLNKWTLKPQYKIVAP